MGRDQDRGHMTENILKLTLEIIYLLTGEDYGPVKKSRKHVTSSSRPGMSGGWGSAVSEPPPHNRDEKILELTNQIIYLLSGEVSPELPDENGDSSTEEWENIEEWENPNQKVGMETPQRHSSPDFTDTEISGGSPSPVSSRDGMVDCNIAITVGTAKYSSDVPDDDCSENETETPAPRKEPRPIKNKTHIHTQYSPPSVKAESTSCGGGNGSPANHSSYTYCPAKDESMSDKAENLTETGTCSQRSPIDSNDPFSHVKEEPNSGGEETLIGPPLQSWVYTTNESKFKKKDPMCFICVECGKNFPYKSHLLRHQKIHMEDRPYSCVECGKSFKLNSNLISHLRIHSGQKPFSCCDCGKSFINKSELVKHERIHTGEKPYPCLECGRRFSRISNLIDHNKIHTGEKPHCCSECGKCFRRHSNLLSHQKTHTMEKVFSCPACSTCFLTSAELVKHQKTHSK